MKRFGGKMNFIPGPNFKEYDEIYLYISDNLYCVKFSLMDVSDTVYKRYLFHIGLNSKILSNHLLQSKFMRHMFKVEYSKDFDIDICSRLKL